jgi:hypothetical protein
MKNKERAFVFCVYKDIEGGKKAWKVCVEVLVTDRKGIVVFCIYIEMETKEQS